MSDFCIYSILSIHIQEIKSNQKYIFDSSMYFKIYDTNV